MFNELEDAVQKRIELLQGAQVLIPIDDLSQSETGYERSIN